MKNVLMLLALSALAACGGRSATTGVVRTPVAAQPIETATGDDAPEQISVQFIVVGHNGADESSSTRSLEDATRRAQMISGLARASGANFRELATQYSDAPNFEVSPRRGNRVIPESSEDAAWSLQVGEVSRPVTTSRGFYIFKRKADPESGPAQIGVRHILIAFEGANRADPAVTRTEEEAEARAAEVAELVNAEGANWNAICAEYSDGPTANTGGDLGVVGRGQMVRAFERAAFALAVDETSGPVRSPFGFHVIRRHQ